jgi:hypothetical protein
MDRPHRQVQDDDDSDEALDWYMSVPGVCRGIDSHVDVLFFVSAARLWRSVYQESGASPIDDPLRVNGLRQPLLRIRARDPSRVQPLSQVEYDEPYWRLPDLDWDEAVYVAFRILLDDDDIAEDDDHTVLARLSFKADAVTEDGASTQTSGVDCNLYVCVLSPAERMARGPHTAVVGIIDRLTGMPPHVVRLRKPSRQ